MINLERIGSFYVGGRPVRVTGRPMRKVSYVPNVPVDYDPNGTFFIEQAYVQYFLPAGRRFETPVVLVHGGGLTGVQWEDTPDGRPGWLMRLLEAGIATYVLDNVERGRASWCAIEGEWPDQPVIRSDEESSNFFRFEIPGNQFPVEAARGLSAQTVPRWPSTSALQSAAVDAVLDRVGPSILFGFSQGGGLVFQSADRKRDLVRSVIAVEPNGIPMTFAPGIPGIPALFVQGDYIEQHAHSREIMARGRQGLAAWEQAGGQAAFWDLPALGIRGNTHMMMMDRNSDTVIARLIDWMDVQHREGVFA